MAEWREGENDVLELTELNLNGLMGTKNTHKWDLESSSDDIVETTNVCQVENILAACTAGILGTS